MKRSIAIASIFTTLVLSSLAFVYALEGDITSPADGASYTQGSDIPLTFETVIGNAYLVYLCDASVDVTGLSGAALLDHFTQNACTQIADISSATSTSTDVVISFQSTHYSNIGNYKAHIVPNNGCAIAQQ